MVSAVHGFTEHSNIFLWVVRGVKGYLWLTVSASASYPYA